MTKAQKAHETCRVRLLNLIRAYPGLQGSDCRMKQAYRKHLRQLELEGYIVYRNGWYRTDKQLP